MVTSKEDLEHNLVLLVSQVRFAGYVQGKHLSCGATGRILGFCHMFQRSHQWLCRRHGSQTHGCFQRAASMFVCSTCEARSSLAVFQQAAQPIRPVAPVAAEACLYEMCLSSCCSIVVHSKQSWLIINNLSPQWCKETVRCRAVAKLAVSWSTDARILGPFPATARRPGFQSR